MAINRRDFLTFSALASIPLLMGHVSQIKPNANKIIGTGINQNNQRVLAAIDLQGNSLFKTPIPDRCHGVTVQHSDNLGLVVARRPGKFAIVFNSLTGELIADIPAPDGFIFYGHGVFSNGHLLITAGNSHSDGYLLVFSINGKLIKKLSLPGLGPHEVIANKDEIVVALGGIHTQGREKLNIGSMKPSLIGIDAQDLSLKWQERLPAEFNQLSIRHLAANSKGDIAVACQYQGEAIESPALIALKSKNSPLQLINLGDDQWLGFKGYLGSIRLTDKHIIATSPRGHQIGIWNHQTHELINQFAVKDVCALDVQGDVIVAGTGSGSWITASTHQIAHVKSDLVWDNHWTLG